MSSLRTAAALAVLLAASAASAQVFKCQDAAGKTIYSDAPCGTSQSGQLLERRRTFEEKMQERQQAHEAQMAKEERRAREEGRERAEAERRATAAAAQPKAPPRRGYAERLAERNEGVQSTLMAPGAVKRGKTRDEWELAVSRAETPQERSELLREATTVQPGLPGLTRSQIDVAKRLRAAKSGEPIPPSTLPPPGRDEPPPPPAPPPPIPSTITNCAGGFCHDDQGGVYHRQGNSNIMTGPNGGTCIRTGNMVECH